MGGKVRACQNCHGGGTVTVWDAKNKRYVTKTCPACSGSGKVIMPNI